MNSKLREGYLEVAREGIRSMLDLFKKHHRKVDPTHLDWFMNGYVAGISLGKDFTTEEIMELVRSIDETEEARETGFRGRIDEEIIK